MLFAEVTPAGVENFLAIVFYLAGGIAAVVGLYKMMGKPAPTETALANQPITVRADREFASKAEHDALAKRVCERDEAYKNEVTLLRQERSTSVGNLHAKIELSAKENRQLFSDLREEFKEDTGKLHDRINDQLKAWAKLEGRIDEALKKTNHPFPG